MGLLFVAYGATSVYLNIHFCVQWAKEGSWTDDILMGK